MSQGRSWFGLAGTGGFARVVMPLALAQFAERSARNSRCVFVDDFCSERLIGGVQVLTQEEFFALVGHKTFNVAIADSQVRQRIAIEMQSHGLLPSSIIAPTARIVGSRVSIGEGAILCDYTILTEDIRVGDFFHLNIYSYVEHDCVVGDFVTFAPRVACNGWVRIEDHAYLGSAASVRNGDRKRRLVVGSSSVVGMGSTVLRDVPPGTTVVGSPARPLTPSSLPKV